MLLLMLKMKPPSKQIICDSFEYFMNFIETEFCHRWRFEALKSRCIIIDRELLLEQNNIAFEPPPKRMKEMVVERFGDYAKEKPKIDDDSDAEDVPNDETKNVSVSTNGSSGIECDVTPSQGSSIMPSSEIAPLPNITPEMDSPPNIMPVPTIKTEFVEQIELIKTEIGAQALDETIEVKPDISTILNGLADVSSIDQSLNIKVENKENFHQNNENSLANELSALNPALPKFREMKLSSERKQIIREISSEISKGNTSTLKPVEKMEAEPTPPTRVKQVPRKMNVKVRRIIPKRID